MKRTELPLWSVLVCTLGVAGCAQQFPLPMTAAQLATYDSGPALVAYLGQPDASPTVCDPRAQGPHLRTFDDKARESLVSGLTDAQIEPGLWRRCANVLLVGSPPDSAAALLDAVGRAYRTLIKSADFEKVPALQDRMEVMQRLYLGRKSGIDGHPGVVGPMFEDLRRALTAHRLGPAATRFGEELITAVDVERGEWGGRPVDEAAIEALFQAGDEKTLGLLGDRLPRQDLRDQARRRVIRIHIAASPYPEVRGNSTTIEEIVFKQGTNPLSPAQHRPVRGRLDLDKVPIRGVLVRQHVWKQTATLLGYGGTTPAVSVLPELKLRDALSIEVEGISQPITLCRAAKSLDPSPCISIHDVSIGNPAAYLDKGGAFHFVDEIPTRDAVNLAKMRDTFALPLSIGGKRLVSFEWRLSFERPEDVVLRGSRPGSDGPSLKVAADVRDPDRYVFTVSGSGMSYLAVVEKGDMPAFRIASRGATGYEGSSGSSGTDGSSGGECEDGGNGWDGGAGGDGGPGGDGGDVVVEVTCGTKPCSDAKALLARSILSEAGSGGPGGSGGAGGAGGSGGPGRAATTHLDADGKTVVDDSGCNGGASGAAGANGPNGAQGSPGRPGRVRFLK